MVAVAQRSFAGGELAPALYARTDQSKYATGLRTCRNMIVQRHGGAANRPGLVFIAAAKDSAVACRLIPFVLDATDIADTYVLEFGNGYIRFYQDGGRVVVSSVTAWANTTAYHVGDLVSYLGVNYYCRAAHTSATATDRPSTGTAWQTVWYALSGTTYEIPTPYTTADLPDLNFVQSGDVITLVHPSYAPRQLSRSSHTNWTLAAMTFGPSIDAPTSVLATGGAAGTIRYWAVTAIKEGTLEESLAGLYSRIDRVPAGGTPTAITWNSVAGAISYNVYRSTDGLTYGLINSAGGSAILTTDTAWGDSDETATGVTGDVWTAAAGQCRNALAAISATVRAYNEQYTVKGRVTLAGCGDGSGFLTTGTTYGRFSVYYSRDAEARVLAYTSPLYSVEGVATSGPTAFQATITVPDNGYAALQIDIVPEVLPCLGGVAASATMNVNTATAPDNSVGWYGGASGFSDIGDTPDYSIGPPTQPTLFQTEGGYPSAVAFFQDRLFFGNTSDEPEKIWGSRIGSYASNTTSTPLQADDALAFRVVGRRVNAVKHMLELGKLVVFGSGREHVIDGDESGIVRPDAIKPEKLSAHGSGSLAPIELDDSAIYVQGRGSLVRDLKPLGVDGYQGTDLTIFAAHLFEGYTIVDWAYQEVPNSVVWAVRSDGALLGLTYIRDQAVWGWHRHDTLGTVERVCVVPEGDVESVYVVVAREIDGETVRYVERMAPRYFTDVVDAIFMDAALSYDGWHTGVTTMLLSGGTDYLSTEQLTLTASVATFVADDVGNAIFLEDEDGNLVRLTIEEFSSTTVVLVRPDRTVSAALQASIGNGNGRWAMAVDEVSGLDHLEGEDVAILADGYVVSSPNNTIDHATVRAVAGGVVTLDQPYAVIHVGLPYISDLETLDLDWPGQRTNKNENTLINRVGLYLQASRGVWAGRSDKITDDSPLAGLQPLRTRDVSDGYDSPTALVTDPVEINVDCSWNKKGRTLVRQVDPLPLIVLSVSPTGYIT